MNKPFLRSEDYRWQTDPNNPKRVVRGAALSSLKNFLTAKRENPRQPYGGSDTPFISKGPFGGLSHAHITQDLSVIYKVENGTVYLYGIYSHGNLGTGTPANINKQKSMATRFANMGFSE